MVQQTEINPYLESYDIARRIFERTSGFMATVVSVATPNVTVRTVATRKQFTVRATTTVVAAAVANDIVYVVPTELGLMALAIVQQ